MESSSDDGDPAPSRFFSSKFFLFLTFCFFSCYQLQQEPRPAPVLQKTQAVKLPQIVAKTSPSKKPKKKIYLTFDDGPNKGTGNVLHIAKDEGVPVTFFLVGEHAFASKGQEAIWDSLKMTNHVALCNHSYTHAHNRYDKFYEQPDSVVADFKRAHDSLQLTNTIVRTPGRNIWRIDSLRYTDIRKSSAAADSLGKAGFAVMGWDLEWHYDHKSMRVKTSAETLLQQIDSVFYKGRTRYKDHLVLLAHDQVYGQSADSFQLRLFLQKLKQKDYELVLATGYPGVDKTVADTSRSF